MTQLPILTLFGIAVGLAMDAFAVSISYGCGLKQFNFKILIYVSCAFAVFQGGMAILGWVLSDLFDQYIQSVDHWVAFGLLVFIGGKMLVEAFSASSECLVIDKDNFNFKRLLLLSIATSIDALAVGISLRVLQSSIVGPSLIIAGITLALSAAGVAAGHWLQRFLGRKVEILGGLILIFIGFNILITHLTS